jgi:CRISPR-associated protein Csm5
MKTFHSYELLITPLSPVHIGTGGSYEPTNYVIENDTLHEFDIGEVVEILSKSDTGPLRKAVDQPPNEAMIKSVQRFFFDRRSLLIARARHRHSIPVLEGVAALYRDRVGQMAQHEQGGEHVINRLEIDRTACNPVTRLPVLFGSSLKGAIRTALLNRENNGQPLQEVADPKTNAPQKEDNKRLQQRLFAFRDEKFELDPLRLVQIGDASWQGESGLPAAEVYLAVNRKKAPVGDDRGNIRLSQAEQKGLYQILECVPALRFRVLAAQLNIQSVDGVDKAGELPRLRFNIADIAHECNTFYRPILEKENRLLTERGLLRESWHAAISSLLRGGVGQRIDRGEMFLMRVGRHSGAESVTLSGVRQIKIMKAKGQPEDASEAKTIWLGAEQPNQQRDMLPFGWLLVEVFEKGSQRLQECDELKTLCERHLDRARAWAARQAQMAEESMRRLAEDEARRRQEDDRQAKLASMSEEERAIDDLRRIYERDKNAGRREPQGELANRRVDLLRKAKEWQSAEMRRKAADLIEETAGWLPWSKQKRAERLKKLEELRNQ